MGCEAFLHVATPVGADGAAHRGPHAAREGEQVSVFVDPSKLHVFDPRRSCGSSAMRAGYKAHAARLGDLLLARLALLGALMAVSPRAAAARRTTTTRWSRCGTPTRRRAHALEALAAQWNGRTATCS